MSPFPSDSADQRRVVCVAKGIVHQREHIAFMDVARAMIVLAHMHGNEASRALAGAMTVSRQTRHNWLTRDLGKWIDAWERRLGVAAKAPLGITKPKEHRISESDWRWIAEKLTHCVASASWGAKAEYVREAARYATARVHLMTISRVTIWRARFRISKLMADVRNEPDATNRSPLGGTCSELKEAT